MSNSAQPQAAIVDYGMGNLFSVAHACQAAGIAGWVTADADEIRAAPAVILPGVGAYGDAMAALRERGLIDPIRTVARSGRPLLGICLGMQLLMSHSSEFGEHPGLDLIDGDVVRFEQAIDRSGRSVKVPQVGWNAIYPPASHRADAWRDSPLECVRDGEAMYFVHSYYVRPRDESAVLSESVYGSTRFCSAIRQRNIFGFQFHPERSGEAGVDIYRRFASRIATSAITSIAGPAAGPNQR